MQKGESSSEFVGQGSRWTGEDLQYYLLAQCHNSPDRDYCLQYHKFPREIALSPIWHETFERMRGQTTRDRREYWSMIGVTRKRDKVMLLHELMPGQNAFVSGEAIGLALAKARECGITSWVGDIHSHPAGLGVHDVLNPHPAGAASGHDIVGESLGIKPGQFDAGARKPWDEPG